MDMQYFGGNCIVLANKGTRLVIDDNLIELGLKSVTKQGDIALFTGPYSRPSVEMRLLVDGPGEYEALDLSIIGIAVRGHTDDPGTKKTTMYKVVADDMTYLLTGHVYPEFNNEQLEAIGTIDVMCLPVGNNGYTLDASGALQLIKAVEPKLVVPTHYADQALQYPVEQQDLDCVLRDLGMEVRETVSKLHLKPGDVTSTTQLEILSRS